MVHRKTVQFETVSRVSTFVWHKDPKDAPASPKVQEEWADVAHLLDLADKAERGEIPTTDLTGLSRDERRKILFGDD